MKMGMRMTKRMSMRMKVTVNTSCHYHAVVIRCLNESHLNTNQ